MDTKYDICVTTQRNPPKEDAVRVRCAVTSKHGEWLDSYPIAVSNIENISLKAKNENSP